LARRRRSTRSYSDAPVERDAIERCLEAARVAPSACNSQPWYFIVIDDKTLKGKLGRAAFSGPYAMNAFAREAPVLIVVVTQHSSYIARLGGYLKGVQYSLIDIGIACEHLILQAAEEGIGTCWLGWFDEKAVKRVLGLGRGLKIDIIISMGYPKDNHIGEMRRKSLDEIRKFNSA